MKVSFEPTGLEGQVRIASLIAHGVSLIAISWFYSCQLRGRTVA